MIRNNLFQTAQTAQIVGSELLVGRLDDPTTYCGVVCVCCAAVLRLFSLSRHPEAWRPGGLAAVRSGGGNSGPCASSPVQLPVFGPVIGTSMQRIVKSGS